MSDPRDFTDEFQQRHESDADFEDRFHAAQAQANWYFERATKPQHAAFRNACATAVALHGHGSMAHEATLRLANGQFTRDTQEASDLCEATLRQILADGDVSEALSLEWDGLCAANIPLREVA